MKEKLLDICQKLPADYVEARVHEGSATHVDQVIPDDSFAEGVPAAVKKENITDEDRKEYFGLLPGAWTRYEADLNHGTAILIARREAIRGRVACTRDPCA